MAKPAITPIIWATDPNYSTGPAPLIGTATKIAPSAADLAEGWNANEVPGGQHQNHFMNHVSQWTNWVALASTLAGLDDHLIQTDIGGQAAVAAITLGNTAGTSYPLDIQGLNSGSPSTRAINVQIADGTAINLSNNSVSGTIRAENFGAGPAAQIVNTGTGDAAQIIGAGGKAIDATCLLVGTDAVLGLSRFGAGATIRGLMNLQPSTVDPTTPVDGDMWFYQSATAGHDAPVFFDGTVNRRAWGTVNGYGRHFAENLTPATESAAVITSHLSTNLGTQGEPAGDFDARFSGVITASAGALPYSIEVLYRVGGVTIETERMDFTALGSKSFYFEHLVTYDGSTTVQLDIQYRTLTAGKSARMERSRVVAYGAF